MIKFPLNPKEESPQLITKHNKTASVQQVSVLKLSGKERD